MANKKKKTYENTPKYYSFSFFHFTFMEEPPLDPSQPLASTATCSDALRALDAHLAQLSAPYKDWTRRQIQRALESLQADRGGIRGSEQFSEARSSKAWAKAERGKLDATINQIRRLGIYTPYFVVCCFYDGMFPRPTSCCCLNRLPGGPAGFPRSRPPSRRVGYSPRRLWRRKPLAPRPSPGERERG